jgi:hypothetical protein
MKKVFILCTIALLAFGCNTTQKIDTYVKKHCNEAHIFNPATGQYQVMWTCDTLYHAPKLQAKCSTLNVCFDAAKGRFTGELVCDSLYPLKDIIPLVIPSFK